MRPFLPSENLQFLLRGLSADAVTTVLSSKCIFAFSSVYYSSLGFGAAAAQASHLLGAELTYVYEGTQNSPYQYHVTARFYNDLGSMVTPETQLTLTCGKNECGNTLPDSFTATLVRTSLQVPAFCGSNYQILAFEGTVQLRPGQWTLSVDGPNRIANVVNLPQSNFVSTYVQATLDNRTQRNNSLPQFATFRRIRLNTSQAQRYSANAFDTDGDSLVYQLVAPSAAPTATAPCGSATAGTIAPHFQVNAATGELLTRPAPVQQGIYALAVRVDEYRRINGAWQQIGSVTRDATYQVVVSGNQMPAFTRVASVNSPTGQLLRQIIRVNPGRPVALILTAADADPGQTVQIISEAVGVVPGLALQNQPNGQAVLTWQVPATLPPGRYHFPVAVYDSSCPIQGAEVLTLSFLVTSQALSSYPQQPLAQQPFPMPFREDVQFRFAGPGQTAVVVTDELGRTVARLTPGPDGHLI